MKIAAFLSHPIQHFSPLWQELARRPGVELKVFYYSRHGLDLSLDREFGVKIAWDVDFLSGYEHEFLPRCWPTRDPLDNSWKGLNSGLRRAVGGADVAYVAGYVHLNNWAVARHCERLSVPLIYQSDSNFLAEKSRPQWRRWAKKLALRPFFRCVSIFLACGDHNRAYLEYYGARPGCIRFSAIPVDTVRFRAGAAGQGPEGRLALRARCGLELGDFVAGFCGKLVPRKRPHDLLAASELAHRPGLRPLFIGMGPMEEQLRRQGASARFAGFVNQMEIPQVLSMCDVLVMPSEYDPHPIVVTEAQCLGIPVILSDACGCYGPNDVFRDQETGILYPCGDVTKLAEALAWMHDHADKRARMGRRARELAELQSVQNTATDFLAASAFALDSPLRGRN